MGTTAEPIQGHTGEGAILVHERASREDWAPPAAVLVHPGQGGVPSAVLQHEDEGGELHRPAAGEGARAVRACEEGALPRGVLERAHAEGVHAGGGDRGAAGYAVREGTGGGSRDGPPPTRR